MSSFKPSEHANELQACGEIARGFLVACCDASEVFDELEESFDQIALPVKRVIAFAFVLAVCLWRDDRLDPARPEAGNVGVGVVALIGENGLWLDLCGQRFSLGNVVNLTFGQSERERVSQRIDDHMDFRGQAAARTAYGLVDAFFLRAPALC